MANSIPVLRAREKPQSWADIASGLVQGFGSTYIPRMQKAYEQKQQQQQLQQLMNSDIMKKKNPIEFVAATQGLDPSMQKLLLQAWQTNQQNEEYNDWRSRFQGGQSKLNQPLAIETPVESQEMPIESSNQMGQQKLSPLQSQVNRIASQYQEPLEANLEALPEEQLIGRGQGISPQGAQVPQETAAEDLGGYKDYLRELSGYANSRNPQIRDAARSAQREYDNILKQEKIDRQQQNVEKKLASQEKIYADKRTAKFDEGIQKAGSAAKKQLKALDMIDKSLRSGHVKPTMFSSIMRNFNKTISNAFLNGDQATIMANIPLLLEGWKETFGVRLSDKDLGLILDKIPDIDKSPEANRTIARIMKKYAMESALKADIGNEIKSANGGYRPADYDINVERRFDDMTKPVRVINPESGNEIEIPMYQVEKALRAGAQLVE